MAKKDQEAKDRIVKAATEMLLGAPEAIDRITVRQIAEQSGVGVGSINYYFAQGIICSALQSAIFWRKRQISL